MQKKAWNQCNHYWVLNNEWLTVYAIAHLSCLVLHVSTIYTYSNKQGSEVAPRLEWHMKGLGGEAWIWDTTITCRPNILHAHLIYYLLCQLCQLINKKVMLFSEWEQGKCIQRSVWGWMIMVLAPMNAPPFSHAAKNVIDEVSELLYHMQWWGKSYC